MSEVVININGNEVSLPSEIISQGIEKGTIEITNDDLVLYKKPDFETFKSNLSTAEYKKGRVAGEEMLIKEARNKYELEFEGKTIENAFEAFKSKIEKSINTKPDERINELKADNDKLKTNLTEWEQKYNTLNSEYTQREKTNELKRMIDSSIPNVDLLFNRDKVVRDFMLDFAPEFNEDGKAVLKKDGHPLKNNSTLEYLNIPDVINDFIKPYIKPVSGGGGGGDHTQDSKAGTLEAFTKEMERNGTKQNSELFNIEMNKRIQNGTLKV